MSKCASSGNVFARGPDKMGYFAKSTANNNGMICNWIGVKLEIKIRFCKKL